MRTQVRCYSGSEYAERPRSFRWEGEWREIDGMLSTQRTPDGKSFYVLAGDGMRYRLDYREDDGGWHVFPLEGTDRSASPPAENKPKTDKENP